MATLVRTRASKTSLMEKNGKLPSFTTEAVLFVEYDNVDVTSASTNPSGDNQSRENGESSAPEQQQQQNPALDGSVARRMTTPQPVSHNAVNNLTPPAAWHHVGQSAANQNGFHTQKPPASEPESSPGAPMLSESTLSMQEIFETDDVLPPNPAYGGAESQAPTDNDDWSNGDDDVESDGRNQTSNTPPLSLYSSDKRYATTRPNEYNPSSDKWSAPSSIESGRNTPTSYAGSQLTNGTEAHPGSMSSNNSSAPRSGSITGPLLYSAIGSLENLNATSLGSLNKRLSKASKDFSLRGGQSHLIPPANQRTSWPIAIDHSDKSKRIEYGSSSHKTAPSTSTAVQVASTNGVGGAIQAVEGQKGGVGVEKTNVTSLQRDEKSSRPSESRPGAKKAQKPSNIRNNSISSAVGTVKATNGKARRVSYNKDALHKKKPVEMFRPSSDAYTPRIEKKSIKYRAAELRTPVQKMASPMGTLQRPNFRDALRRVAMIIHQHIVKIERRFEGAEKEWGEKGLFRASMRNTFSEANYCTPTYRCTMVRIPMARPGMVYGLKKKQRIAAIPSEEEIYEFAHQLFKSVQLSSECSIVCLIYVERLMETAKVPLLACTWRPIFMCGLLLASKVWQDLSSWNIEFASVYPQFSLESINRLELNFLREVKWDLYISSSLYAKYYFALRSIVEKVDFRQRYNRMVGGVDSVAVSEALKIQKRSEQVKEEALLQLSRSM